VNRPVLLVEDNDIDAASMLRVAQAMPFSAPIRRLRSGEEAVDYLWRRGEFEAKEHSPTPLLILLDIHLPGLSGLDVLNELKGDERLRTVPVIMFSSSRNPEDINASYREGANSYLHKPRAVDELRKATEALSQFWLRVAVLPPGEEPV